MKRTVRALFTFLLVLAITSTAMAEIKVGGFYRLQFDSQSFNRMPGSKSNTSSFIDNRMRMRVSNSLNDSISVVYYGEVDTPWGEQSKGNIGAGGQVSADGVNVETKNAYVDFKIPSSSWVIRTGIQGWGTGPEYAYMVANDDMAGISLAGDLGPVQLDMIYSKWDGGARDQWDDVDFLGIKANYKANEQLALGGIAIYLNDQSDGSNNVSDYYVGARADYRFSNYGVNSFLLYRNYNEDDTSIDGKAWMFDVAGNAILSNGTMKVHFAYFPEDDDAVERNHFDIAQGQFEYPNDNLMLFLTDVYYNNDGSTAFALKDAAYAGYGLWFVTISGKMELPHGIYAKYGVGHFSAVDDRRDNQGSPSVAGTNLGTEIDAMIGKKFADKYDVSLRGGYGFLGDFYDSTTAGVNDPDDMFKVVAMLHVDF